MLNYILWNQDADLFSVGAFTLRWNGLLLIVAFLLSRQILVYVNRKEGKPAVDLDALSTYLIIGVLAGSRLGHILFYQPELWSKPLAIFLPFEFKPSFHFTGMVGFSSHSAAIGAVAALWLFSRKSKSKETLPGLLDKVSMLAPVVVAFIYLGAMFNSDVEGKPTNAAGGTVFAEPVTRGLLKLPCCIMRTPGGPNPLTSVEVSKGKEVVRADSGHQSMNLYFFFKPGTSMQVVDEFMLGDVKNYLYDKSQLVQERGDKPLHYAIFEQSPGEFTVRVATIGVARFPVQLMEAAVSLLIFAFLFWHWMKHRKYLRAGIIFGLSSTLLSLAHFALGFLKEPQGHYFKSFGMDMTQVLSVPVIAIGLWILITFSRKAK